MKTDLIIIGAGPAGVSAAIAAKQRGMNSVVLLERSNYSHPRPGEHLSPRAIQLLKRLGIWKFHQTSHLECSSIRSSWGSPELIEKPLMLNPYGYGRHVNRCKFDQTNFQIALELGVFALKDCRCSIRQERERWLVVADGNGDQDSRFEFESPWLLDATGRSAAIAKHSGCIHRRFDGLIGIQSELVREFCHTDDSASSLLIESAELGWWYAAPLSANKLIVTFMTDADICSASNHSASKFWVQQVRKTIHIQELIARFSNHQSVAIRPAMTHRLDPCITSNYVAIGDAALSLDPLSSQGIQNSIESAITAIESICRSDKKNGCRTLPKLLRLHI